MPPDPRTRYAVLQPIVPKDGDLFWFRVGCAYRNADGTIDAYFDAVIVGHRFRLRVLAEAEFVSALDRGETS